MVDIEQEGYGTMKLKCPKCGWEQDLKMENYMVSILKGSHPATCKNHTEIRMIPVDPLWKTFQELYIDKTDNK